MKLQISRAKYVSLGLILLAAVALPAAAATCESLSSLSLPNTTITAAESVAAGAFTPAAAPGAKGKGKQASYGDLPAFCRVAYTVKPSSDSDIRIELWMPAAASWSGNFEADGNGGWTGSIAPNTLAGGLRRGNATAMTDTGHEGGSASFAMGHPEKVTDFGYRSVHEMALQSKALIAAYYGRAAKYSYWDGCSAGGRQGLMEAQRYPEDFDGIVAGSPGLNWSGRAILSIWVAQAQHKEEAGFIPQSKFALLHNAAIEACDAKDGVKDGVIEDPTPCKFDPKVLECTGSDTAMCLTAPQVETARKIYAPVLHARTKKEIVTGFEPGSELGWTTMAGQNVFGLGADLFKYVVFQDPNWDYKTMNWDSDIDRTLKASESMNAMNPDLKKFLARNGKMIQYHGWTDPQIAPRTSVRYYESALKANGAAKLEQNYRLFMVPGMNHCGGGDGTSNFDMMAAMKEWVEQGKAPDHIPASRIRDGKVDRTRPLCPYPQVAVYNGSGSTDDAANFSCRVR